MRRYLLAAAAAAAIASPAAARDGSTYIGIEAGGMIVEDIDLDYVDPNSNIPDAVSLDHKTGLDVDLIGGHDFGMVRAEVELGWKRASLDEVGLDASICGFSLQNCDPDASGKSRALSAMANLLLDVGDDDGWSGYLGAGIGIARVKIDGSFTGTFPTIPGNRFGFNDDDSGLAWQGIAGVRTAISQNMDVGLKYRFFNTRRLEFRDDTNGAQLSGRWRSHSLLLSLIYNFYTPPPPPAPPPPPPPPPPAPPATQTCPDGTVILATEACPAPPPPPPPPPPAPERG